MIRNECSVCEELWQKIGELRDENDNLRIEVGEVWSDNEALRIKMAAMKKLLDAAKPRIKDLRLASAKMQEDLLTLEYEITANT